MYANELRLHLRLIRDQERPLLLPGESFALGDVQVGAGSYEVRWRDALIRMASSQVLTLALLVKADGRAVSPEDIVRVAHRPSEYADVSTVSQRIHRLRERLQESGIDPKVVQSVSGHGYRLDKSLLDPPPHRSGASH